MPGRDLDDMTPLARAGEIARRKAVADMIRDAVRQEEGNLFRVAKRLGVGHANLFRAAAAAGLDLTAEAAKYRE